MLKKQLYTFFYGNLVWLIHSDFFHRNTRLFYFSAIICPSAPLTYFISMVDCILPNEIVPSAIAALLISVIPL